jgi:hypothetical protein
MKSEIEIDVGVKTKGIGEYEDNVCREIADKLRPYKALMIFDNLR